jgi:NhaP-type Na+/H+ or K+/H+ antiporter
MDTLLTVTALCILGYALFSRALARSGITMAMVFLSLGIFAAATGRIEITQANNTTFHHLAELTLAILLFADATMLRRATLGQIELLAGRMLGIGLPLTIGIGAVVNLLLLPDWPIWECFLLAALLAPTDAALGQAVQSNTDIPETLRDSMNAESGLNDGLAFPFVVFFAALAEGGEHVGTPDRLLVFIAMQAGIGLAVGLAVGAAGGMLERWAERRGFMDKTLDGVLALALVGSAFFVADSLGGNSFVSVFAAGFAFANTAGHSVVRVREFMESDGKFLAILSFFFIGGLMVPVFVEHVKPIHIIIVLVSLFVVRPVAVWLSLIGTSTTPAERLFFGWFGPRGLATALFAIFVLLDFPGLKETPGILVVATGAVLISAFLHGLSARWATRIFPIGRGTPPPD